MDKRIINEKVMSDSDSVVDHEDEDEDETKAAQVDLIKESHQNSQQGQDVDLDVNDFLSNIGVSIYFNVVLVLSIIKKRKIALNRIV